MGRDGGGLIFPEATVFFMIVLVMPAGGKAQELIYLALGAVLGRQYIRYSFVSDQIY